MSDTEFQNPENLASIEETEQKLRARLVDLLGGYGWALFLLVLSVIVLLIDTFGLPFIMANLKSASYVFVDLCRITEGGGAGGFAVALFGLLAVTLLALRIATPQSVYLTWFFLMITAIGLQAYIAHKGGLVAVWENTERLRPIYLTNMCEWLLIPSPTAGRDFEAGDLTRWLNARYNYQVDATQNNINVHKRFTDNLATNLALLFVFAVFAWLAAIIVSAVRLLRRFLGRPQRQLPPDTIFGWFNMNRSERAIVVQAAALTMIAAMSGPPFLIWLARSPELVTEQVGNLLWIGPLALLADLARVALFVPESKKQILSDEVAEDETPALVLEPVASSLRQTFANRTVLDFKIARQIASGSSAANSKVTRQPIAVELPRSGTGQLHFQSLTEQHYELFIDALNQCVLDRGRTALVICPFEALDALRDAVEQGFIRNPGNRVVNWWRFGDERPESVRDVEVIVVSPESLEAMLETAYDYQVFMTLLGGLLILNLHRLDLGLLHVNLTRMKPYVGDPRGMVAVIQSEFRLRMQDWIKNLPLLENMTIDVIERQEANISIDQYVIIAVTGKDDEYNPISRVSWPTGTQLLLRSRAVEEKGTAYFYDRAARHIPGFWRSKVVGPLRNEVDQAEANWAEKLKHPVLVPIEAPHPVALIEDQLNLVDALNANIGTPSALEALRLVVRGDYPVARFLQEELESAIKNARTDTDRRNTLVDLRDRYSSITPMPVGGPIEWALMIRQEFEMTTRAQVRLRTVTAREGRSQSLTQARLNLIWPDQLPALQQLRISNTKSGLERLFRITLQPEGKGDLLAAGLEADRTFSYILTGGAASRTNALATLRLSVDELDRSGERSEDLRPERLLLADHGLTYAHQTRFAMAGRVYEVLGVNRRARELNVRYEEEQPLKPYTFVRDYALLTDEGDSYGFAADRLIGLQRTKNPYEVASGYVQVARKTRATYEFNGLTTPSDKSGRMPSPKPVDVDSPLQLRSVAQIRVYDREAPVSRAAHFGSRRNSSREASVDGVLAFTLVTTLQDILATCFTSDAHRIAVLSPHATMPGETKFADSRLRYALDRQPWLYVLSSDGTKVAKRTEPEPQLGLDGPDVARHEAMTNRFFELAHSVVSAPEVHLAPRLDLFVVEDSDHDLGVAKAISDDDLFVNILRRWIEFLDYCCRSVDHTPEFAYSFGSGPVPDCYDFEGARDLVRGMYDENA